MFSLLQQTAPAAVQNTPETVVVTPAAPADAAAATGTITTTVTVPLDGAHTAAPAAAAPEVQPHGSDAIHVPAATGADPAPAVAEPGLGHAPADAGHAVVTTDGTQAVVTHTAPGTDAAHATGAAAHDAAQSAGMPQLDFSTFGNQIFWLLVTLAVIYLILSRVALPRIGRVLADRQGLMTADLAAAEDFKRKARDAEAAYDKALADARADAGRIVAANKAEIQGELNAAIARADAEIGARTAESERRIAEIRATATQDARTVALDVAAELVRTFGANADAAVLNAAVDARIKGAVQ